MKPFPFSITPKTPDEKFMMEALKEAWRAYLTEETPVGAVIVADGRIIARGFNQVEMLKDATAHAEMLAVTAASNALDNWRLTNAILYTTLEPCMMCLGALFLARVSKVIYAAPDIRHGALGSFVNLLERPHPTHTIEAEKGPFEEESAFLMKEFFRSRR